jgi:apolipoprotein N-acyltransferase
VAQTQQLDKINPLEKPIRAYVLVLFVGLWIGLAWSFPLQSIGAPLIFLACLTLSYGAQRGMLGTRTKNYTCILVAGMLAHLFGFYWIFGTIRQFGEFPIIAAGLIFLLFITISILQFQLFLFAYSTLPKALDRYALRLPLAWISVEVLAIRIFPWSAAHPLSPFPALLQLAEFGGIQLVSFVLIWFCDLLIMSIRTRNLLAGIVTLLATLIIPLWGQLRIAGVTQQIINEKQIPVTLVQGNVRLSEKHDRSLVFANMRKYLQLSLNADSTGKLIIWPETVLMDWLPENVGHVSRDRRLPHFNNGASLLFGALSYRSESELFNSAFAIGPNGDVPLPYHKRILMPFGEFTPFADVFPYLRTLNNTGGDFSEGSGVPIISVPLSTNNQINGTDSVKVTPLICYEDVLPQIATQGARNGAELLVNITNDAWFGESIAPLQHHQIALFRAIENRRFLVRATNTGLSAIVSATGETQARAPLFQEATLSGSISTLKQQTFFSKFEVQYYWQLLSLISSCLSIFIFLTITRREA